MSKMVYALAVVSIAFVLMYGGSVVTTANMVELADRYTRQSLWLQHLYADSVKGTDVDRVYVYDNASFFDDAMMVIRNGIRVKTKDNKYAVLSEAAQAVLDVDSYKEFSEGTVLHQDEIGYYV